MAFKLCKIAAAATTKSLPFRTQTSAAAKTLFRSFSSEPGCDDGNPFQLTGDTVPSGNPFQLSGPRKVMVIKSAAGGNKDHMAVRVALPGVGEGDYKVWVNRENNAVCIEAREGEFDWPAQSCRKYQGSVVFDRNHVKVEKIFRTDVVNGILKIVLTKNLIGQH